MPYQYNYGTRQYPEYQSEANADSRNGRTGAMTPGAIRNQRTNAAGAQRGGNDAYSTFRDGGREWWRSPQTSGTSGSDPSLRERVGPARIEPGNPLYPTAPRENYGPARITDPSRYGYDPSRYGGADPNLRERTGPLILKPGDPLYPNNPADLADTLRGGGDRMGREGPYFGPNVPPSGGDRMGGGPQPIDPNSPLGRLARERGGEITRNPLPGGGRQANPAFDTPPPGRQRAVNPNPVPGSAGVVQSPGTLTGTRPDRPIGPPLSAPPPGSANPPILDQYGVRTNVSDPPPKPQGTEDPNIAAQWYGYWIPGITGADVTAYRNWAIGTGNQGVHIIDWWRQGRPTAQAPPTNPEVPNATGGGGGYWDQFIDNMSALTGGGGGGLPAAPPPGTPPTTTPPPQRSDPTQWRDAVMPTVEDPSAMADLIQRMNDPRFKYEQEDLLNILRGQAALTGDSNAQGFTEIVGRDMGRLLAEQGRYVGDKAFEASEAAKDRAIQQYGIDSEGNIARYQIDAQKFSDLIKDDTARYNIQTNADLERYLTENQQDIERWKISIDAIMQKYSEQMRLRGIQYSADRQFDAAALDAAIRSAIQESNERLGFGRLEVDRYGMDQDYQVQMLEILRQTGLTPAMLADILRGVMPNQVYDPRGRG